MFSNCVEVKNSDVHAGANVLRDSVTKGKSVYQLGLHHVVEEVCQYYDREAGPSFIEHI